MTNSHRYRGAWHAGVLAACLCAIPSLQAQPAAGPEPPAAPAAGGGAAATDQAQQLEARMIDAFAGVKTYRATVTFERRHFGGRFRIIQEIYVATDRESSKLLVDKPDVRLVITDGKLRLTGAQVPGRYLELEAPQTLTYNWLVQQVPYLSEPVLPDLVMLLGGEPSQLIPNARLKAVDGDGGGAEASSLVYQTHFGAMTLQLDEKTQLIRAGRLDYAGPGGAPSAGMAMTYQMDVQQLDEPLPADTFAFDVTGLEKFESLRAFLSPSVPAQAAQVNLIDAEAPAFELGDLDGKKVTLADLDAEVVVLDFWATWCGPCRQAMPHLQKVYDWAREEKKSVAIFAVNLQETEQQVRPYWEKEKFTIPVLMDRTGRVGNAYGATAIPRTVIIHGGKVAQVHEGFNPKMEKQLKAEIEVLLGDEDAPAETP